MANVYGVLRVLREKGVAFTSAKDIADAIGTTIDTVKKDISLMHVAKFSRKGYDVNILADALASRLSLDRVRRVCIVGLGRLGTSLLEYPKFLENGFDIVAGFDASNNKMEMIRTKVPLYSVSLLEQVIKDKSIDLAIVAVPAGHAQKVCDTAVKGGIKGILNFSAEKVSVPPQVALKDMDVIAALRFIAAFKTK
jgi:redox-sensing transcriptional repressor